MQSGRRRDLWQALTPLQQSEALRLTVAVIASAVSGSAQAVASCLAEAGRVAPQVEAHVLWAARELTGPMRLVGDTESVSSRRAHGCAPGSAEPVFRKDFSHDYDSGAAGDRRR